MDVLGWTLLVVNCAMVGFIVGAIIYFTILTVVRNSNDGNSCYSYDFISRPIGFNAGDTCLLVLLIFVVLMSR